MKYVITEKQVGKISRNLNEDDQYTGSGFDDALMKKVLKNRRFGKGITDVRFEGVNVEEYCVEVNFSYVYKYKEQLKLVDNNFDEARTMLTNAIKDSAEKLSIIVEMIDNPHNFKRCYTIKERVYFDSRMDDKPMDLSHTYFYNGY